MLELVGRVHWFLARRGWLVAARRLHRWLRAVFSPGFVKAERNREREFTEFRDAGAAALGAPLGPVGAGARRTALVAGIGAIDGTRLELALVKSLELAGFEPVILAPRHPWVTRYYQLAKPRALLYWDEVLRPAGGADARGVCGRVRTFEELLEVEWRGARIGRCAAATALRSRRTGSLDLRQGAVRRAVERELSHGMAATGGAEHVLDRWNPSIALFVDRGYTPHGELFDLCLAKQVDTITWNTAHRSGALILKRYTRATRDEHPASLSSASWQHLRAIPWSAARRDALQRELRESYASSDWFSEVGTQLGKQLMDAEAVRRHLRLDPRKKTAVIFPHIVWDGTFFWGRDLFGSYEDWLVEVVRAACANPQLNWVIKIHPANLVKDARDGKRGDSAELRAIRQRVGSLPPHVVVMHPQDPVSTYSLFAIMDYCLTVRGTVGIEAASFGVPVLTAGTGRFDHRGFTIDAESREEYLTQMSRLHDVPALSDQQRQLAERFAYGVFLVRPLALRTISFRFAQDARARMAMRFTIPPGGLGQAADLRELAGWLADGQAADYLRKELLDEAGDRDAAPVAATAGSAQRSSVG